MSSIIITKVFQKEHTEHIYGLCVIANLCGDYGGIKPRNNKRLVIRQTAYPVRFIGASRSRISHIVVEASRGIGKLSVYGRCRT